MHNTPEGLWTQPDQIRAQIQEALDHEQATHALDHRLTNAWRQCLSGASPDAIETRVTESQVFLTAYIAATPPMLEAVLAASKAAGISDDVENLLLLAAEYFRRAVDFIPDHLGMLGLIDDAYTAHCLMEGICDTYRRRTGGQVISIDLAAPNSAARALIGEPTATHLDNAIADMLKHHKVGDLVAQLNQLGNKLPIVLSVKYPALDIDISRGNHALRLGLLGGTP